MKSQERRLIQLDDIEHRPGDDTEHNEADRLRIAELTALMAAHVKAADSEHNLIKQALRLERANIEVLQHQLRHIQLLLWIVVIVGGVYLTFAVIGVIGEWAGQWDFQWEPTSPPREPKSHFRVPYT